MDSIHFVDIALKFVEHINSRNLDGLTSLMTGNHTFIIGEHIEKGREVLKNSWNRYFSDYPEYRIYISEIFLVKDTVILMGRTTGSHLNLPPETEFKRTLIWSSKIKNHLVYKWCIYEEDTREVRKKLGVESGIEIINPGTLADEINTRLKLLPSGTGTAQIREIRKKYSRKLRNTSASDVLELVKKLFFEHGQRFVAYELLYYHKIALESLDEKEVEELGRGINDWSSTDMFACFVSGPAWLKNQISDKLIHKWAGSKDRWWRRAALVSTVYLKGDVSRTLTLCRMLVKDHDDMIVKAMSWALRKLSKYDSKSVEDFLKEYDLLLAARVKREVKNKLATGLKNPRKGRKDNRETR